MKTLLLLLIFSFPAFALDSSTTAEKYIRTKYLKKADVQFLKSEERIIPFPSTKVFRMTTVMDSPEQSWILWVLDNGTVGEFNTSGSLRSLVQSLEKPLNTIEIPKPDLAQAKKISMGILYYLSIFKKKVSCKAEGKTSVVCSIGYEDGPMKKESLDIIFDSKLGKIGPRS